jgi:hypothetical protein
MPAEAQEMLADLLRDFCAALDPEHPESVRVGPVDFGPEVRANDEREGRP